MHALNNHSFFFYENLNNGFIPCMNQGEIKQIRVKLLFCSFFMGKNGEPAKVCAKDEIK
jgi:hypothetical protein